MKDLVEKYKLSDDTLYLHVWESDGTIQLDGDINYKDLSKLAKIFKECFNDDKNKNKDKSKLLPCRCGHTPIINYEGSKCFIKCECGMGCGPFYGDGGTKELINTWNK